MPDGEEKSRYEVLDDTCNILIRTRVEAKFFRMKAVNSPRARLPVLITNHLSITYKPTVIEKKGIFKKRKRAWRLISVQCLLCGYQLEVRLRIRILKTSGGGRSCGIFDMVLSCLWILKDLRVSLFFLISVDTRVCVRISLPSYFCGKGIQNGGEDDCFLFA